MGERLPCACDTHRLFSLRFENIILRAYLAVHGVVLTALESRGGKWQEQGHKVMHT